MDDTLLVLMSRSNPHNSYSRPHVSEAQRQFFAGVAIDPNPRIILEKGSNALSVRALDLICPIGMGQRALIVAPPGSGKTTILKEICQAVVKSAPDIKTYCLLIDERPEEITDFKRSVATEVYASSSDHDYEHHVKTAQDLMEKAYAQVAAGGNVMILIDSLTRLGRVHNATRQSSGRTLSGGVDSRALEVPRRIFGSARKIEGRGSLTIVATILVQTGSRMDDVIFEEFKGTGNMECVLSRDIAQRRIFPAIDIAQSGTRKHELLLSPSQMEAVDRLKMRLTGMNPVEAAALLKDLLEKNTTNAQILESYRS